MALKKQLSITVVNQAGEGSKLCAVLKEAGINIEAISVAEFTEGAVLRLIVSEDRAAVRLLREKGYAVLVRVVLALELENRPGALGEVMTKLARGNHNVNYCYGSISPAAARVLLIFAVDDPMRADLLFEGR